MTELFGKELLSRVRPMGRTLYRPESGTLFFNWTASGLEFQFKGSCLTAEFSAMPGAETDIDPLTGQSSERPTWPRLAACLDGEEQPSRSFAREHPESTQLIFRSRGEESHLIRIVKLTENGKTYAGLMGFWTDGEITPPETRRRRKIEFIGDSITCGFGNDTTDRNRGFFSAEENGWLSHGAIAARLLDMDYSIISSSGICLTDYPGWPHPYAMNGLYPYTDRMLEDRLGVKDYTPWDFEANRADYVVLNLGTNDANAIDLMGQGGPELHRRDYAAFIRMLRQCHGPRAHIVCALGSMDYYLYSDIQAIVNGYRVETGDKRIHCYRYPKMRISDPAGAQGHPHIASHRKMALAISDYISALDRQSEGGEL